MRRLIMIFALLILAVVMLSSWRPGPTDVGLPTVTPTLLPANFTLIPTFVPSYPCELQNVERYDEQLCRNETVKEYIFVPGDGVTFIQHDYHFGQGCWDSVSQDIHELRVCAQASGETSTLTDKLVTGVVPSPSGEWLAFGTMDPLSTDIGSLRPHLYRVRLDGTGLQQLDSLGFKEYVVGAPRSLRWLDDDWLAFDLWDGSGEDGWHPYRLKADGSGIYKLDAT